MSATERFSLLIQSQTTGAAEVQKLQETFERLIGTVDKTAKKTREVGEGAKFEKFADGVKNFIQNPLEGAGNAVSGFLKTLGPMGTAVTAGASVMALLAKTGFDAAKSLGEYGDRIEDISIRTGLSAKEVSQFSFAMKRSGGDIASVEGMMRKLSQGLADSSEEGKAAREGLAQLGIKARDTDGSLRPMSKILLELSEGLGRTEGTANRNALAIKIMGRSALEALPDLLELSAGVKRAKELGLGPSNEDLARWKTYQENVVEVEAAWEKLKRAVKEPLAASVVFTIKADYQPAAPGGAYIPQRKAADVFRGQQGEYQLPMPGAPGASYAATVQEVLAPRIKMLAGQRADRLRFDATKEGVQELLKTAREAEATARKEYLTFDGAMAEAEKRRAAWRAAEAEAGKYEARLKSINEQEALVRRLGTFEFKEGSSPHYPRATPSLLIGQTGRPFPAGGMAAPPLVISQEAINKANQTAGDMDRALAWAKGMADAERLRLDRMERSQKSEFDHRVKMLELLAGPNGEVAAVEQIFRLRVAEAKTLEEYRAAEMEHEERIAEIQKRRAQEWRQTLGSVFDATLAGGQGLRGLALGYVTGTARTMFQNIGSELLKPGQFSIPGQGTADSPNLLGKVLAGTPFGMDPLKAATDANTLATVENTRALYSAAGAGMGAGALGIPAAGSTADLSGYFGSLGLKSPAGRYGGLYKGIGGAAALAGGAFGAYSGFSAGGAQGALLGSASIATAAGALLPMLSKSLSVLGPIGMIAGMGLGLGAALLGDPKQRRAEALSAEAERRRFALPSGTDYLSDIYGRNVDYDYRGGVRVYKTVIINADIETMDAASFKDFARDNSTEFGAAVTDAITSGNAEDLVGTLRQVM